MGNKRREEIEEIPWDRILVGKQDHEDISRNWSRDSKDIWQKEHASVY